MQIFNKWGALVWEISGYNEVDRVFRGIANASPTINIGGEQLIAGTYFYIINFNGDTPEGKDNYYGFLYITR